MPTLLKDDAGIPIPQYMNDLGAFEPLKGASGAMKAELPQLEPIGSNVTSLTNYTNAIRQSTAALQTLFTDALSVDTTTNNTILAAILTNLIQAVALLQDIKEELHTQNSGGEP